MAIGIERWGTYIPYFRLRRAVIAEALGTPAGRGARAVAGYDEDTTSMGVEAARSALDGPTAGIELVLFATTAPAYADKANAATVHAALDLPEEVMAMDAVGSVRSGLGSLLLALGQRRPALVVTADMRAGLPGGADERQAGDAAAAFVVGSSEVVAAELLGHGSASAEFLDRWRLPGGPASHVWEERFAEGPYLELADRAWANALKDAGLDEGAVTHVAIVGAHARAVAATTKRRALPGRTVVDDLGASVGVTGAAHAGLLLAAMLDEAEPGQVLAVQSLSDGSDVVLLRVTDAAVQARPRLSVVDQIAAGRDDLSYLRYLSWRGLVPGEPPRRPEPDRPAAPPSLRASGWKLGFAGSRCRRCQRLSLPPQRVCYHCGSVDDAERAPVAGARGVVANFTVDRLAYTPSPPMIGGLIDLDGGGRFQGEFTDVREGAVQIGSPMELTFRRFYTSGDVHNYFWKARPQRRVQ